MRTARVSPYPEHEDRKEHGQAGQLNAQNPRNPGPSREKDNGQVFLFPEHDGQLPPLPMTPEEMKSFGGGGN
jgi:hypothetical protein